MSKEPPKQPSAEPEDDTRDELVEFLKLTRRLLKIPKEEIDAARSNGSPPKPE